MLKHLQNWALAFQSSNTSSSLSNSDLVHLYNRLRTTTQFPPVSQSLNSSMITSMSAPEWVDSDLCQRCRTPFTVTNRKHHCRSCGGVFCGDCSSKKMKLEHLGIDQEVRVCDGCHKRLSMPGGKTSGVPPLSSSSGFPPINQRTTSMAVSAERAGKSQEEIDFEKAIAMSLADGQNQTAVPNAHAQGKLPGVGYGYEVRPSRPPTTAILQQSSGMASLEPSKQLEEEDPDLAAAIRASLADATPPSISTSLSGSVNQRSTYTYTPQTLAAPTVPSYELAMSDSDSLDSFSKVLPARQINIEDANELFYRADKNRGKMMRALEDSEVKTDMLGEINRKLQTAVRLYDSLLERRIGRHHQPSQHSYQRASIQSLSSRKSIIRYLQCLLQPMLISSILSSSILKYSHRKHINKHISNHINLPITEMYTSQSIRMLIMLLQILPQPCIINLRYHTMSNPSYIGILRSSTRISLIDSLTVSHIDSLRINRLRRISHNRTAILRNIHKI